MAWNISLDSILYKCFLSGILGMMCKMCLKEFTPHGSHVTCSKACSLENKRQSRRRSWARHKPDRYSERIRLKLWRIAKRVEKRYAENL